MTKKQKITFITLCFSLYIGCEDLYKPYKPGITPIVFEIDWNLPIDENGYPHLTLDISRWQTLHRISGHVYRNGNPVNVVRFSWSSNLYWVLGDTLGYIMHRVLTDDLVYVSYDTTYITGFNDFFVPIVNGSSYSTEAGEVNTMIAPVKSMRGDTATIFINYFDSYYGTEYNDSLNLIFD